jgi:hypothetical protein
MPISLAPAESSSPDENVKTFSPPPPLSAHIGLSPSPFHDQQLPSGEVPPLKRLQPPLYPIRSVSPMSNGRG